MSLTLEQFGIDRLSPQERFELIGLIWDSLPDDAPFFHPTGTFVNWSGAALPQMVTRTRPSPRVAKMLESHVVIWTDAPELAIPEMPAMLSDSSDLWLAYETTTDPRGEVYSVVRFQGVIDIRLSPINDEGIGQHPYARFGLRWYSFNEIIGSAEAAKWSALHPRHWVVTFKDGTLDILCRSASVISRHVRAPRPLAALLSVLQAGPGSAWNA